MSKMAQKKTTRPSTTALSCEQSDAAKVLPLKRDDAEVLSAAMAERETHRSLSDLSVTGLLAYATGTSEFDLVDALLQEMKIRLRTLRAALKGDVAFDGILNESELDTELYMLERRVEVLEELWSRFGRTKDSVTNGFVKAHETRDLDAAAEE